MKKYAAILLAFCLAFTISVSAAPTRDLTTSALEHEALIAQVQPLVDAAAAAAIRQDIAIFSNESQPPAALVEGLLYQALSSHLVVQEASDSVVLMAPEEAQEAARGLFFMQELPELDSPVYPGVTLENGLLRFDTARQDDFIGTHIYDISVNEEEVIVKADIFRLNGIVSGAVEAPEESLTWLGHIGLRLKPMAEAAVGFALASYSIPERYTESRLALFVQKDRFEVQYPDFLSKNLQEEGAWLSLASEDGSAALSVRDLPGTLESLKDAWYAAAPAGGDARVGFIENNRLFMAAPGVLRLAYFDPQNGEDSCLVLEMTFPAEKEHEFSLYETFLDNSFVVYSNAVG